MLCFIMLFYVSTNKIVINTEVVNKSIEVHGLNVNKIQKCFKTIKKQRFNHQSKDLFWTYHQYNYYY